MDVDWDFFLGMLAAFMLWFSWSRYKAGPKRSLQTPPPEPCTFKWIGSLGRLGHTHSCILIKDHKINHICHCGSDIDHTPYDPANY